MLFAQISDLNSQVNDLRGKLWVFYALCSIFLLILTNFVNVSVNNAISIHMSNTFGSEKEWTAKMGIEVDSSASARKLRRTPRFHQHQSQNENSESGREMEVIHGRKPRM
jgi:hypothetical protein